TGQGEEMKLNLAGRAGRWSMAHWKTATFGWIAFAVAAIVLGSAAGVKTLADSETGSGETARAESMLADANFKSPATENVLVQSRDASRFGDDAFTSAVAAVVQTLSGQPDVVNVRSPLERDDAGLASA